MKTQLDHVYEFEKNRPNDVWLTQPIGGGEVRDFTFKQAMDQARRMAAHLKSLNLPEKSQIALFSKNSAWWFIADLAIWMAGHVSVPLYPTLSADTIGQILDHSESKLIFVGKLDGYDAMAPGIPNGLSRIVMPLAPANAEGEPWDDIISRTEPMTDSPTRDADDLATLVYTSGSTGVPKGVMHSFRTMCSARSFSDNLNMTSEDRMLSYLPLAHAFERALVETTTFLVGFHVFFAESLETFVKDLNRARPTMFVSVPRLWMKFQMGVFSKMPPKKLNRMLKIPIVKNMVRKKVLEGLGLDQVRFAGSGSAPIPAELIDWYRALGLELLEGYGMTENFSLSHMNRPGEVKVGYVGPPHDSCDCKLDPDSGEILVKSPGTMLGYFKMEEQTAECMTEDGYLKTGDLGSIDSMGRLKITGRLKELFKTSKGKYVAPAPIENKLQLHDDVEMALVSGADQTSPFGMVYLSEQARANLAKGGDKAGIESSLAEHLKSLNAQLDHHEQLATLVVVSDDWTVDNGMLTPTLKLKRNALEKRYQPQVDAWYAEKKKVIWA